MNGTAEGAEKCFYAAADTKGTRATEYFTFNVTKHPAPDEASSASDKFLTH